MEHLRWLLQYEIKHIIALPIQTSGLFLYPLKIPQNQGFSHGKMG